MFFFVNYEDFLEHDGNQLVTASVPSAAERKGDFSELLPPNPNAIQLYNPFDTTYSASGASTRSPGKGANQAVAVARLKYPVQMIGRLGNDSFGTQLRSYLQAAGVQMDTIAQSEGISGVAVIVVSESGENSIVVTPGANAQLTPRDLETDLALLRGAAMVLAQLEILLETVESLAEICARGHIPLILDPAPARGLPPAIFARTAWFTPNQSEAAYYLCGATAKVENASCDEVAEDLLERGCRGVLLKMGEQGVLLTSQDGERKRIPAFPVQAVDKTAAGDAFNGGFAVGLCVE